MANIQLTQELVKSLFDYKDGFLYWKIRPANRVRIGDRAGNYHKGIKRNVIMIYSKNYLSSRLIFIWHNGYMPDIVDHEDRNQLNDLINNLRSATQSENCKNKKSQTASTSRYLGVYKYISYNKWCASISINSKIKNLGYFVSEAEAALAYNRAAVMYHKEFANLNIISPQP